MSRNTMKFSLICEYEDFCSVCITCNSNNQPKLNFYKGLASLRQDKDGLQTGESYLLLFCKLCYQCRLPASRCPCRCITQKLPLNEGWKLIFEAYYCWEPVLRYMPILYSVSFSRLQRSYTSTIWSTTRVNVKIFAPCSSESLYSRHKLIIDNFLLKWIYSVNFFFYLFLVSIVLSNLLDLFHSREY